MTSTLQLEPYNPQWPAQFAVESNYLRAAIAPLVIAIEHVGSTAVPGMLAKPVLDIAIAVEHERHADACIAPLTALGYEYRGPYGDDAQRRYYVRDVQGRRFAHIHLYIMPAPAWHEKLAFRDLLRADAEIADAYIAEKRRVAEMVAWDKAAYSTAKGPFIQRMLQTLR